MVACKRVRILRGHAQRMTFLYHPCLDVILYTIYLALFCPICLQTFNMDLLASRQLFHFLAAIAEQHGWSGGIRRLDNVGLYMVNVGLFQ